MTNRSVTTTMLITAAALFACQAALGQAPSGAPIAAPPVAAPAPVAPPAPAPLPTPVIPGIRTEATAGATHAAPGLPPLSSPPLSS